MKNPSLIKSIIIDDESYWQTIIKKLADSIPYLSIEGIFSDIETAYEYLSDHDIELIFLDVQINNDNGIDLIKRLHKIHSVIIISSHSSFALEGYSISAVDYVTKPIDFDKFEKAVQKAMQQIQLQEKVKNTRKVAAFDTNFFLIKEEHGMLKIHYKDVIYISALENYIKIITRQKTHIVLTTLLQFERSINNHPFLRIHRSHIVNLNAIKLLNRETCILVNDHEIPIGEMYKNDIHEIFIEGRMIKR